MKVFVYFYFFAPIAFGIHDRYKPWFANANCLSKAQWLTRTIKKGSSRPKVANPWFRVKSTKILTLILKLFPGTYKVPFQNFGSALFLNSFIHHECIKNQSIGRLQIFEKCQIYILVDHYALLLPEWTFSDHLLTLLPSKTFMSFSSVKMKLRYLRKTFLDVSAYSGLWWGSAGWRSKLLLQRALDDPSWGIRVLYSGTIGHFPKKKTNLY